MKLMMHEVLQKVSNAKTKKEKIALLQQFNTQALRSILIINFDESVISLMPQVNHLLKRMTHQKVLSIHF